MIEDYGRRLLPSILQHVANHNPQQTFALVARTGNVEDGFDKITYRQVANAVNYVTRWLLDHFENGNPTFNHPTIAYLGVNDLRYNILFYGAVQARYKVFLPSPRNPIGVTVSLFEQTECTKLVYTAELAPLTTSLQQASGPAQLQCEQLPSLRDLLAVPGPDFKYDLTYADAYKEPILILHSSGSTGKPKTVTFTHGSLATIDVRDFPTVPGRRTQDFVSTFHFPEPESYMYDVFPLFHLAGFNARIIVPLIIGTIPVYDPPSRPPSGPLVAKTIRECKPRGLYLPPVIIEQVFQEPDHRELFEDRDIIFYAGGPLSQETGSRIAEWTQLCQFYGSTEVGQVRLLQPLRDGDDWAYLEFHPHEAFELQPMSEGGGLHELVLFAGQHVEKTSTLYHNYPDLTEWRTKDLFEQHPTKPNLWKFHARVDDILVLSSGEKLNPLPLESNLSTVPGVRGVLVTGTRRSQPALLIELNSEHAFADPQKELWPSIQAANTMLPSHGRITRSMIIIATPEKPFKRAPKGSIVRRQTEELYAEEINQLYEAAPERKEPRLVSFKPSAFRESDVTQLLQAVLDHVAIDSTLDGSTSLYEHGLDSVKTVEVVGLIKANLLSYKSEEELRWLSIETVYLNPTIGKLSQILLRFLNEDKTPEKVNSTEETRAKIEEYAANLSRDQPTNRSGNEPRSGPFSIAITGTTGFFGQYLLSSFVSCPSISRIYCLNRSPTAREKFEKLGLKHDTELVFLRMNITSPRLGLNDDNYARLLKTCNLVVHNAWQVDFNLPLASFNIHLEGIRQITTLCAESALQARLVFVSSIASTGVYNSRSDPELTISEEMVSIECVEKGLDVGYARSKCVAEHVLERAASQLDIPTTILRLGHVLPAAGGARSWPPNDSLALFLQTCRVWGKLASDFLDTINWLPADSAAAVVSEVVQDRLLDDTRRPRAGGTEVLHIVNPHERPWSSIAPLLKSWCSTGGDGGGGDTQQATTTVSMREWVEELQHNNNDSGSGVGSTLTRLPALRIPRFFDLWAERGRLHHYATDKAMAVSQAMRELDAPSNELIEEWLRLL